LAAAIVVAAAVFELPAAGVAPFSAAAGRVCVPSARAVAAGAAVAVAGAARWPSAARVSDFAEPVFVRASGAPDPAACAGCPSVAAGAPALVGSHWGAKSAVGR